MKKVKQIRQFIELVNDVFGKEIFIIADHWDNSAMIGLQKSNKLIYVAHYGKNDYFYECEILKENYDVELEAPYSVCANGNCTSQEAILAVMSEFFEIERK